MCVHINSLKRFECFTSPQNFQIFRDKNFKDFFVNEFLHEPMGTLFSISVVGGKLIYRNCIRAGY